MECAASTPRNEWSKTLDEPASASGLIEGEGLANITHKSAAPPCKARTAQDPNEDPPMEAGWLRRHRRTVISAGILLVLGLHIVPVVYPSEKTKLWPILDWGMYKDSRPPGPITTYIRHVYAVSGNRERVVVDSDLTGLSRFTLAKLYIRPMAQGDSAAAANLLGKLNEDRKEDPFVEIRMESAQYTVTDSGIVRQDHPLISYRAKPGDSSGGSRP